MPNRGMAHHRPATVTAVATSCTMLASPGRLAACSPLPKDIMAADHRTRPGRSSQSGEQRPSSYCHRPPARGLEPRPREPRRRSVPRRWPTERRAPPPQPPVRGCRSQRREDHHAQASEDDRHHGRDADRNGVVPNTRGGDKRRQHQEIKTHRNELAEGDALQAQPIAQCSQRQSHRGMT